MKQWTQEEWDRAVSQVCAWGQTPPCPFSINMVTLQCELNEARELLAEAWVPYPEAVMGWKRRKNEWLERNKESK